MKKEEFENALIDVRKAYRLLFLYQMRILDLVGYIGDSLNFRYEGGWSWFSANSPKEGKGLLECWAWDWLNMYFYEFKFVKRELNNIGLNFSILLQSDTGFYDASIDNHLAIEGFGSAENSVTKLIFLLGKNCWDRPNKNEFDPANEIFKKQPTSLVKSNGYSTLLVKSYLLTDLFDIEGTSNVINDWRLFCKDNNIDEL